MVNLELYVMEVQIVAQKKINVEKWKVIVILIPSAWKDSNVEIVIAMLTLEVGVRILTVAINQKVC